MSRKHFEALAEIIRTGLADTVTDEQAFVLYDTSCRIAETLSGLCPTFDAERFLDACGFGLDLDVA